MKTILFFLIITLSFTLSKAQWVELDPGVNNALYDIYAITPDIVVAVGANGIIIKTTDGGETWQQKNSGTTNPLIKLQFPTPDIGYIIGSGGAFLKTIDSGETWFPITAGAASFYQNISCINENLIFIICNNGILMKSTDGGENWNEVGTIPGNKFQFLSDGIGYMMTPSQGLFRTENGGGDWIFLDTYYSVFQFLDENVGFYYTAGLYKTTNGGYNFEFLGEEFGWELSDFFVINENVSWGILEGLLDGDGSTRGIIKVHTLEDGTYTENIWYDNDEKIHMLSIHFADENTGYIVGYSHGNPTIWKNSTGINTLDTNEPTAINEIMVYPNPASTEITIEIQNNKNSLITLTDMTGKQVYSGDFHGTKMSLNVERYAKGIYILTVFSRQHTYFKKIIIN